MKKSIRNLIIGAAMTAGIFTASTSELAGQFVQTDMNFRSGASITSTVIGSVPAGAEVEVLGSQNGWDLISYNGVTGYISGGNLGSSFAYQQTAQTQTYYDTTQEYFDNNWSQTAAQMDYQCFYEWKTVYVSEGYLALRDYPTYDSTNEIGQLYTGDVVQIAGEASGSYIMVYSPKYGAYGWVNAGFLG